MNKYTPVNALLSSVVCSVIFLTACSESNKVTPTEPDTVQKTDAMQSQTIRLIHLNDIHANLTPHLEQIKINDEIKTLTRGGLARISTRIKALRAEQKNSLLMNIGDTYHGGVEAMYTNGNAIVEPVNALGIDIGVPGNWDFSYGPNITLARYHPDSATDSVARPAFPNLAANVELTSRRHQGETLLPATKVIDVGGVKVGFIGITSDIVPRMSGVLAIGMRFLSAREDYLSLINTHAQNLRNTGVSIVVVMSELGIHKDLDLSNDIKPGLVDVVFSAHTHEATFTPQETNSGTVVVEAGNDTYLGYMDFQIIDQKVINMKWTLESIDENIVQDEAVLALVNEARAEFVREPVNISHPSGLPGFVLKEPITTVVGKTNIALNRRHVLENNFNNAVTDVMKKIAGTDIAITPGFRFDSVINAMGDIEENGIASGNITLEDLYRFYPVPTYISVGQVDGARLKQIIESNLSAVFSKQRFNHSGGWFDGFSGLDLKLDLSQPDGNRLLDIRLSGSEVSVEDTDILNVTGCSRPIDLNASTTLCSYSGFTDVTRLTHPITAVDLTPVDMLRYSLENDLFVPTIRKNIQDISDSAMWPETGIYQPLNGL